jgi:multicomponent K+:H+ antiporter subunit C
MELLMASGIGVLTATGVYLLLRPRSFEAIIGLTLLSFAVNLFLFSMGRLVAGRPPILEPGQTGYADPLPQALVLTAIVIAFGMTALVLVLALRAHGAAGTDDVDGGETAETDPDAPVRALGDDDGAPR